MREDQLTLPIANEKGFVDWYAEVFMPKHIPSFCEEVSIEVRKKRIAYQRKLAISFGFTDPTSQTHVVTFMWEIGPLYYTFSPYKEIMEATHQTIKTRIDLLYGVTKEQENAAIERYNPSDWQPE